MCLESIFRINKTEADNGYLVYVLKTRKVVEFRDLIVKESEVGSIPENTETPNLLDEGSPQLRIWIDDDCHQDDVNKDKRGTSTAIKVEWHDAESVNTGASEQGRAQTGERTKGCSAFFWRSQGPSCCDRVWLCGTQNSLRNKQGDNWDQWHREMKDEVKAQQDNETWNPVRPPRDRDVIPCKWLYKTKLGASGQVDK